MGDKQRKRGDITKLRLAYDSTAQGGDGQFHETARSKPVDPDRSKPRKPVHHRTDTPYEGQYDVHQVQRLLDGGIEFDRNLDAVMGGVRGIRTFLRNHDHQKYDPAREAMLDQLRRVAMIDNGTWSSRVHDGAVRFLKKEHGKQWETHYEVHRGIGELRHCTPDGLRDIAVSMLFRDQRKRGDLAGAKALVDFMDVRAAKGFAPPKRDDRLYDCPSAFVNDFCSAHWAYNRSDAAHDVSNTYAATQEWPYDWVMRDDHPALLQYMINKNSCLLAQTIEVTPKVVRSYFQTQRRFVHGRPLQSDQDIDLSQEFVDANHPLARLPGHMRHLVEQVKFSERPDVRQAAQAALKDINEMDWRTDAKLRAQMLDLKKKRQRHQTIWSPPETE